MYRWKHVRLSIFWDLSKSCNSTKPRFSMENTAFHRDPVFFGVSDSLGI